MAVKLIPVCIPLLRRKTLNKQWDLNTPVEIYYDSMKSKYLRLRYRKAAMVANSEPVEDVKKNGNIGMMIWVLCVI